VGEEHRPHTRRVVMKGSSMRLSDLVGKIVYDERGVSLGRIDEVRVKDSNVEALICGPRARLQRMTQWRSGNRVAWQRVRSITGRVIHCGPSVKRKRPRGNEKTVCRLANLMCQ
jgi:sporulation protein YlmC with PRC-barrel domain